MNTLLLIDGNAILHRAYHALPPMNTHSGTPTNAVYGFFTMLHKATVDFQPNKIIVCFDTPKPTFRKELSKEYQSHRPKVSDEFIIQAKLVRELLDAGGITHLEKPGFEADDVIGTVAEQYKKKTDCRVLILTGDKDILQLVDSNVFVITPQKGLSSITIYNEDAVKERFGVSPEQIPDFKALMGDPSDNYKGAKGIGPKTATKLLQKFGNVENLLKKTDSIPEPRIKQLVVDNKESIELSKTLATISRDVEVEYDIEKTSFEEFRPEMKDSLQKLELFSLLGRLFGQKITRTEAKPAKKEPEKKESSPQLDLFS